MYNYKWKRFCECVYCKVVRLKFNRVLNWLDNVFFRIRRAVFLPKIYFWSQDARNTCVFEIWHYPHKPLIYDPFQCMESLRSDIYLNLGNFVYQFSDNLWVSCNFNNCLILIELFWNNFLFNYFRILISRWDIKNQCESVARDCRIHYKIRYLMLFMQVMITELLLLL